MRYLLLSLLLALPLFSAEYPKMGEDIYDVNADAKIDIAHALTLARAENKNVILKFGANWCIWCHRLSHTMKSDATVAQALAENFILVSVDTNTRNGSNRNLDVVAKYGRPTRHGLPALVVLDPAGKVLTTKNTGDFEIGSEHDPVKLLAFLTHWSPAN
jgi:thioredoxin-related protein